ncbi:MAG: tRNA (guanosine(37)-N1)-methyltransferase TrmD [Parcubacteria group bacterium]
MRFDILTIFPKLFDSFMRETLIAKAIAKRRMSVHAHDIRRAAVDKHHTVDDRPYGGGPGMILKVEPIVKTLKRLPRKKNRHIVLLTPQGRQFTQYVAKRYASYDQLILISGRYEGFDHRIMKYIDEELSIGPYVLSGGEIPAMVVIETVSRLIPGVIGHPEATVDETFSHSPDYIEYPQYTRPGVFRGQRVPKVLLGGNHKEIRAWRAIHSGQRKGGSRHA